MINKTREIDPAIHTLLNVSSIVVAIVIGIVIGILFSNIDELEPDDVEYV